MKEKLFEMTSYIPQNQNQHHPILSAPFEGRIWRPVAQQHHNKFHSPSSSNFTLSAHTGCHQELKEDGSSKPLPTQISHDLFLIIGTPGLHVSKPPESDNFPLRQLL